MPSDSNRARFLRISPETIVKAVAGYVATVFTAVSLWIGVTVSELTDEVSGLTTAVEAQTRENARLDKQVEALSNRLLELERKL